MADNSSQDKVTDLAQLGGNVHAPMKTAEDMGEEAIAQRSHTTQQISPEERSAQYEKFMMEVTAIAARGGSIEAISTRLSQFPALSSQAEQIMDTIRKEHSHLPETEAEYAKQIEENHQAIAGALLGGAAVMGAASEPSLMSSIGNMLAGALERYKNQDGLASLGLPSQAIGDARGAGQIIALNTMEVDAPAFGSGVVLQPTLGIPGRVRQQTTGLGT